MKERVKQLRKSILKLSQTEFGVKIGLSQKAIANIETGATALTPRNFEIICRTWNVNPDWLRSGTGEVFIEQKESVLQEIVREFELTPDEAALIAALLELPQEYRAGVVKYVKEAAAIFEKSLAAAEQDRKYIQSVLDEEEAAFKRAAVPKNFDSS